MIEDDPRIDPADLRQVRFSGSFRRYDAKAVDDYLESIAERIAATNAVVDDLRSELDAARREPPAPASASPFDAPDLSKLTDDELVTLVGEETAHVLSIARKAATDIRTKAEDSAARLIREATAEATQVTEEAAAAAAELTAEAATVRDAAVAEAEAEAARIREAAAVEAEETVATARQAAEEIDAAAAEVQHEAQQEAERIIEEAKDEGRAMVAEAKSVRTRVLEDLQRRRDLGRSQVERLAAGRDQLLDAYAAVRANLDEITGKLEIGLLEAGTAPDPLLEDGFAGIVISGLEDDDEEPRAADDEPSVDPESPEPGPEAEVEPEPEPEPEPQPQPEPEQEAEAEPADAATSPDEDVIDADVDAEADESAEEADDDTDVDALFAKIRSERAESVARAQKVLAGDEEPTDGATADDDEQPEDAEPQIEAPETDAETTGSDDVPAELLAAPALLAARAEVIGPLDKKLSRSLKRHLADEQNEVLDVLRRSGSIDLDELLPPRDEHVAGYARVAAVQLGAAARAGAADVGGAVDADVTALANELGASLIESFRRRIERSAADVDGDADALDERLRALYREWKVEHIGAATTDSLLSAYALGQHAAAADGARLRWLIDPDQGPCPDAQDNALAGAVTKGEPFPTGDECPQAHPGCRCVLAVDA